MYHNITNDSKTYFSRVKAKNLSFCSYVGNEKWSCSIWNL